MCHLPCEGTRVSLEAPFPIWATHFSKSIFTFYILPIRNHPYLFMYGHHHSCNKKVKSTAFNQVSRALWHQLRHSRSIVGLTASSLLCQGILSPLFYQEVKWFSIQIGVCQTFRGLTCSLYLSSSPAHVLAQTYQCLMGDQIIEVHQWWPFCWAGGIQQTDAA